LDKGILTSPLFTQALVEEVQKARPAEVVIAEGTAVGQNTKKALPPTDTRRWPKQPEPGSLIFMTANTKKLRRPGRDFEDR